MTWWTALTLPQALVIVALLVTVLGIDITVISKRKGPFE